MRYKIILLFLFSSNLLFAQITEYNYFGSLLLKNNPPMSFSLELIEQDGKVSGYSITNHNTKDETKSEIQGLYFKKNKTFQLQETQIIYTKSEVPINNFCYIRMNLKLKSLLNKKRLEGDFYGNFLDSSSCAEGKIMLLEKSIIDKKIKKIEKKIEKIKKKEIKKDKEEITTTKIIKDGDSLNIDWNSKFLIIKIWDSNQEDGDKINLIINDNIILDNFETKNKPKRIKYKLVNGENIINIQAVNTGSSPPNTSRIELIDKNKKYPMLTQLEIDKSAIIKITK
jgi:hypothetical protein